MEIINILILSFAVENLTYLLLFGNIFDKPRKFIYKIPIVGNVAICHLCLSFWVAVFIVLTDWSTFNLILALQGASRYIFMLMDFISKPEPKNIDIID